MKRLAVIGSTGSVGQNTLKVIQHLSDRFAVYALGVHSGIERLAEQTAMFKPKVVAIAAEDRVDEFVRHCNRLGAAIPEIERGAAGMNRVCEAADVDIVVSAAVGAAGLEPTFHAVAAGKTVALANKEAMVVAGELLRSAASRSGARIIPIDSEHSALDQCLRSGSRGEVRRLILTASGGPFRETPNAMLRDVTPEQALNHPTWKMGKKITVDSATLMNKGLEVIEARWLFDVPAEKIDIMVHPQSIVHSMVEFVDGSVVAQLGAADMRQPIQYALTYPDRLESCVPALDWSKVRNLDFSLPDETKFPCIALAYQALRMGGTAPAVLNAADEVAVAAFLRSEISFPRIADLISVTLEAHNPIPATSLEAVVNADRWARGFAQSKIFN